MDQNSTARTREALNKDFTNLKRDVTQVATDAKQHAGAQVGAAWDSINEGVESIRQKLLAQPVAVLGLVFMLGVLFGLRLKK
jgi:hypothetical protein